MSQSAMSGFRYDEAAIRAAMKAATSHAGDPAGALTEAGLHPFVDEATLALAQGTGARVLEQLQDLYEQAQAALARGEMEEAVEHDFAFHAERIVVEPIVVLVQRAVLVGLALGDRTGTAAS